MDEYPKIETYYDRDPENPKRVVVGAPRLPEFDLIERWLVTEKVDGTNTRVVWSPDYEHGPLILGRTDRANWNPKVYNALQGMFSEATFRGVFPQLEGLETVTLYGEAYGPQIQSGGWYRHNTGFRLFDVKVGRWWLDWHNVEDVAQKLGLQTVPVLSRSATLEDVLHDLVFRTSVTQLEEGDSQQPSREHEGVVCRTDPLLFDRRGKRVMWKLKVRDLRD